MCSAMQPVAKRDSTGRIRCLTWVICLIRPVESSFPVISKRICWSIDVVNALDAGRDSSENLVGDSVDDVGKHGGRQLRPEDDDLVALAAGYVGDIDHAHVHTYISHVRCALAVDEAVAVAAAKVAVEAVGIAYGQGGDSAVARQAALARVA